MRQALIRLCFTYSSRVVFRPEYYFFEIVLCYSVDFPENNVALCTHMRMFCLNSLLTDPNIAYDLPKLSEQKTQEIVQKNSAKNERSPDTYEH